MRIAREWERVINYRILVSLQMRERRPTHGPDVNRRECR
jgi:hypothetical protein